MFRALRVATLFTALAVLTVGAVAQTLTIGDKAPPIQVAKWLKGSPVELGKEVTVVDFWATWCEPCHLAMRRLTQLSKRYGGKVQFVGVNVWEDPEAKDDSYLAKVESFVKAMGDGAGYSLAADGTAGKMTQTWLQASGQEDFPATFILDKSGKILWIGNPLDGLDKALDQVLDGKFDLEASKKRFQLEQKQRRLAEKVQDAIVDDLAKQNVDAAIEKVDKLIASEGDSGGMLEVTRLMLLFRSDEKKAFAYARELLTGALKDEAELLNTVAWAIVEEEEVFEEPDYKLALDMAKRAVELTEEKEAHILDTLALAYFRDKQPGLAVVTQEKAIALAEKTEGFPEETLKEFKERLDLFKKG